MKLLCVGLNWKTPIALREQLALEGPKLSAALEQWKTSVEALEVAVLSTCNRTEIYAATNDAERAATAGVELLGEFLASFHRLPLPAFRDHLYFHEDSGTARHLFRVAAGLDSLILGEAQILGQCKAAYQAAVAHQTAGPVLHGLFQKAFHVAKRVHTETGLARGRLSIASAAIDYIKDVFDRFDDKTVLVIGAGKMAELTLTHLASLRPKTILVTNRSQPRAEALAAKFGGQLRPFAALADAIVDADMVVSSTGSEAPILRAADFGPILRARRYRDLVILDIAVPRDFDPAIGALEGVYLRNIDDLEKVREQTLRAKERELDRALKIIDAELAGFEMEAAAQLSGPLIGELDAYFQRITDQELERLKPRLNGVSDQNWAEIEQCVHRLKNKYLHPPKAALRKASSHESSGGLLEAARKLFGLR